MNRLIIIITGALGLLMSGCVNNGHFARADKNLPYDKGDAVTKRVIEEVDADGKRTTKTDMLTQSPMAVNKDIVIEQLRDSRDAFIAQAGGRSSGNGGGSYSGTYYGGGSSAAASNASVDNWQRGSHGTGAIGGHTVPP